MSNVILQVGFVLFLFLVPIVVDAQHFALCPPSRNCIPIRQCQPLMEIARKRPLSRTDQDFLVQTLCERRRGADYIVCCPMENYNNDDRNVQGQGGVDKSMLLPKDCGRDVSMRIVGGEKAEIDEFPWMTLLEYRKPNGIITACGAVLISRRYVLTAAHCIKGKDLPKTWTLTSARLGEYDTRTDRDCVEGTCADPTVSIGVIEAIVHRDYNPKSQDQRFDIALLRLQRDVFFTDFIQPICLPWNETVPNTMWVTGFGKTEVKNDSKVKLKLSLKRTDIRTCSQRYKSAGVNLGAGQLCAGGKRGEDSCRGDSGGPLMSVERAHDGSNRWTVVGVVSFGPTPCGMDGWPGVYTKVADFVPWILENMRP